MFISIYDVGTSINKINIKNFLEGKNEHFVCIRFRRHAAEK